MESSAKLQKQCWRELIRNYYYYKYVPGYSGIQYYTTCMIDTNFGNQITYNDLYPAALRPNKQYVVSLKIGGQEVNFDDADAYYNIFHSDCLAAGWCSFNNGGVDISAIGYGYKMIPNITSAMR